MASAQDYANWIVKNADKKGTPEFETVTKAYQAARSGAAPVAAETTVSSSEGMPTPRPEGALTAAIHKGYTDLTGRNFESDINQAQEMITPPSLSDLGGNIALRAQQSADIARSGTRNSVEGFQSAKPFSALLGAGQQLLGGAGVLFSPVSGAIKTYIGDPLEHTLGYGTGERANMIAETVAAPPVLSALGRGTEMATNLGGRAINAAQNNVFTGMGLNKLAGVVGDTAPDVLNALRRNREIAGVETGPEAAAGVGNVDLSRYAAGYEKGQPYADIATRKAELLKGQAGRAEATATGEAQAAAADIAAPDVQKVGDNLINIAEKEKKLSQQTVIGPKFKAAEELGKGADIEIPNVLKKANELVDTIDPDAAAVLSRKLSKFQGETTTPEFIGPGGATFKGKPVTAPPTATLEDIGDIRTAINDAAAKAKAAGSDGDYKRLMELHDEVTNAVKNSETLSPEAKNAYFDAVNTYKTEHAPRFKTGLQVNLFKISKGENGITPSNVINKFFNNADTTDNFVALFGKNPSAMSEAQKGMEGLYRDKVIKDGVIDQAAHDAFMKRYGAQIDKLDAAGLNIRDKLSTAAQNTETALAPSETIQEVKKAGGNTVLPEGPKAAEMASDVNAAMQKLSPDDIDAVTQIARRAQAYKDMKSPATALDEVNKIQFLNTTKRIVSEVYATLAQKLGDKQARRISELLSTPEGTQAFIETALKHKATQAGRIVTGTNFNTPFSSVIGANALAPQRTNQNELRR
jgi:hypothetical protein